jgi:hypothetical protein
MIAATNFSSVLLGAGRFLSKEPGPVEVVVEGHGTWYAEDAAFAFAWAKAARIAALPGNVSINVYVNRR